MMLPAVFRWGLRSCHHKWLTNVKAGASSVGSGFPTSKHSAHSPIFATNKAWVASAQVKNNSGLWNKIAAQTKTYHCACGGICCNHSPFETTWNSHRKCLASKASKGEGFSLSRFAGQTPTQWTWHHTIIIIITSSSSSSSSSSSASSSSSQEQLAWHAKKKHSHCKQWGAGKSSMVNLGNKKLTGDRRQMTENMVNLSLEKLSVNMLMLLYQTFSLLTAKS